MTAMQIVGWVLSSLVGFVVLFAIVWFPISRRLAGRDQVVEVHEDKWFLRSYAGRAHTIIKTRSDPAGWNAALKRTTAAA